MFSLSERAKRAKKVEKASGAPIIQFREASEASDEKLEKASGAPIIYYVVA